MAKLLHDRFNLIYNGTSAYTLEPIVTSGPPPRSLTFNRNSGDIILNAAGVRVRQGAQNVLRVYGVMGTISLSTSDYLVLITGRERRTTFMGHDIYQATDFQVLPIDNNSQAREHPAERHLIALIHAHLAGGMFWFSYTWDLTRRLQAHHVSASTGADANRALWETADDRFFWNKYLQSRLIDITMSNPDQDLSPYILPVMYGTFDLSHTSINGKNFVFALISRRSRYRAGTRYFRRGIDDNGNVANFNETEQVVLYEPSSSGIPRTPNIGPGPSNNLIQLSYVQIRGSIPLFWAEINTLRYKPDLSVMDLPNSKDALEKHLNQITHVYGSQTFVNLVDDKRHEQPVKEAYDRAMAAASRPDVRYQYFDFHNECKGMKYERISKLTDILEEDLAQKGWFHQDASEGKPRKLQLGTVRTNCMDNLDRTNVVQTHFAKYTLNRQLRDVGILLNKEDVIDNHPHFMLTFRTMWSNHADWISNAYAGSGAMKTDFTRTGKRTQRGNLEDGYKSVTRYIKNNFFDGPRQDGFDLMTGVWTPRRGTSSAMALIVDRRPLFVRSMPHILLFSIFMILCGLTLPRTSGLSLKWYFSFWVVLALATFIFIRGYGIEYVNWPRLNPSYDVIYYNGPGFRKHRNGMGWNFGWLNKLTGGKSAQAGQWIAQSQAKVKAMAAHKLEEIEMGTKRSQSHAKRD